MGNFKSKHVEQPPSYSTIENNTKNNELDKSTVNTAFHSISVDSNDIMPQPISIEACMEKQRQQIKINQQEQTKRVVLYEAALKNRCSRAVININTAFYNAISQSDKTFTININAKQTGFGLHGSIYDNKLCAIYYMKFVEYLLDAYKMYKLKIYIEAKPGSSDIRILNSLSEYKYDGITDINIEFLMPEICD